MTGTGFSRESWKFFYLVVVIQERLLKAIFTLCIFVVMCIISSYLIGNVFASSVFDYNANKTNLQMRQNSFYPIYQTSPISRFQGLNLVLSRTVYRQGDEVLGVGTANPNDTINIKLFDADKTIVKSEIIRSDLHGIFSLFTYRIPVNSSNGTWEFYATDGMFEANQNFLVGSFSPYQQLKLGISSKDVECNNGMKLMIQKKNDSPACIFPIDVLKFVERGWIASRAHDVNGTLSVISSNFYCLKHRYYSKQSGFFCPV